MTNTSLNISGKIDSGTIEIFEIINNVTDELDIRYVVVGATARDIVMHYGYGADIQRATSDVDFGINVASWDEVDALKAKLLEEGFTESRQQHRLISPGNVQIDIVPFGGLENENSEIEWQPNGDFVMSVLGFQEAFDNAEDVLIQEDPDIEIPVATPEGMALLKLISWMDRERSERRRDTDDLAYLLESYEKIPSINDSLYESPNLAEQYEWDTIVAGAHQLGIDAADIASDDTYEIISELLKDNHESLSTDDLLTEMPGSYEHNKALLDAFSAGFFS